MVREVGLHLSGFNLHSRFKQRRDVMYVTLKESVVAGLGIGRGRQVLKQR